MIISGLPPISTEVTILEFSRSIAEIRRAWAEIRIRSPRIEVKLISNYSSPLGFYGILLNSWKKLKEWRVGSVISIYFRILSVCCILPSMSWLRTTYLALTYAVHIRRAAVNSEQLNSVSIWRRSWSVFSNMATTFRLLLPMTVIIF
jgi:hypothetical protein